MVSPQELIAEPKPSGFGILPMFRGFMPWSITVSVYTFLIASIISFSRSSNLSVISSPFNRDYLAIPLVILRESFVFCHPEGAERSKDLAQDELHDRRISRDPSLSLRVTIEAISP